MLENLNSNIKILEEKRKVHSKASEEYIHVFFTYPKEKTTWDGWVPVEYRRTGISIKSEEELINYLNKVYDEMKPSNFFDWKKQQDEFWGEKEKAKITKSFFDVLSKGGWKCVGHDFPENPNFARRIQDLKEFGYTLATDTKRYCPVCKKNKTHIIMLPIKRGTLEGNGYETWSSSLRKRIIKLLGSVDAYENTFSAHCLPDHKFSEIRWDDKTKSENLDTMTDGEIFEKFQLLTNQRNQQKREICRTCYQTGKRGIIFGIPFFYKGNEYWDESIPKKGEEAEKGCEGCAWYDINRWRKELLKNITKK